MATRHKVLLVWCYVMATALMVQQFVHSPDQSLLAVVRWTILYVMSVVNPLVVTIVVRKRILKSGATLDSKHQLLLFMPALFATISAQLALELRWSP